MFALAAATLVCAFAATSSNAAETGVVPDVTPTPAELATAPEGEIFSSSIVRRSPMLAVRSARIRRGRLAIAGRLARGTTGTVHGVARYRGGKRSFATHVDHTGRISIHERLPGGKEAQTARVTLVYGGSGLFRKQRVTLKAFGGHAARSRFARAIAPTTADAATLGV